MTDQFNPSWRLPPGEFIEEAAAEWGFNEAIMAANLGRTIDSYRDLIAGRDPLTEQDADRLHACFGASAELWLNLETGYRKWLDE